MSFPTTLPQSRIPDPMLAPPLRWGVMGTGWIADQFVRSVQAHTRQEIAAVGSRNLYSAQAFADSHGISKAHASYEELVADDTLDIIYIATPHTAHLDHAIMALNAGRHILIEKPMALSHAESAKIVSLVVRSHGLMVRSFLRNGRKHYGPGSSWKRHDPVDRQVNARIHREGRALSELQ